MIRTIRRTTAHRGLIAAGVLVSGAVLLTGCSSSSTASASSSSTPAAGASSSGSSQFTAYRTCLSQHGVTMPSGHFSGRPSGRPSDRPSGSHSGGYGGGYGGGGFGFGGGASANPTMAAAAKACASLAPKGGFGGGGAGGSSALVAFIGCMKSNGVTVTDQQVRSLSTSTDPKTVAAYKVCDALLPTRGSKGPGAGASPSA
ncbi:hypothetical protein [Streptacidiphilus sp. P02-A3a]|uniref:hypothetical protein n=1 Tax=Streptacidiphilus sp. P02-A3a TaxID=2704468 RepID=UPI0015FD056F|nr:hypothetical protein [Streptacidiphilus sp. P02-A3a]QMU66904.1 hypothetical protein GXP74_00410 [Streptacidiphilus sp. P02-A3a]